MSSPRINTIIAIGCALGLMSVILFGVDAVVVYRSNWLCVARVWTLVFSFSCTFGSMFAKTWRVHVLFTNKKLTRKVVKDSLLLALVGGVLFLDLVILVIWQVIDPLKREQVHQTPREYADEPGVEYHHMVMVCACQYMKYWSGTMYIFKASLLIFGIFFAWETRKVRVEALNDSHQIGVCVYNVVIMSAVAVPITSILNVQQVNMVYGVVSVAVLVCALTTLCLVFGSKMPFCLIQMLLVCQHGNKVDAAAMLPFAASLRSRVATVTDSNSAEHQQPRDAS